MGIRVAMQDPSQRLGDIYQFAERTAWYYEAVTFSKAMVSKPLELGKRIWRNTVIKTVTGLTERRLTHCACPAIRRPRISGH